MVWPAGTVVAVKVRHPGVGEAIQRDFALMMRVARLTSMLPVLSHLRLEDTLAQFAAPLREQVCASLPTAVLPDKEQYMSQTHFCSDL